MIEQCDRNATLADIAMCNPLAVIIEHCAR